MNNKQFLAKALKENTVLIADCCFLMHPSLEIWLQENRNAFVDAGKTIYIMPAVHQELARLVDSDDTRKAQAAMNGASLVSKYSELFSYKHTPFTEEDMQKAFADNDILAELTANRQRHRQILLTNDTRLARDASRINLTESCRWIIPVDVCRLDADGVARRFQLSDLAYLKETATETANADVLPIAEERDQSSPEEAGKETESHGPECKNGFGWKRVLTIAGVFGIGFVAGMCGSNVLRMLDPAVASTRDMVPNAA